MMITRLRWWDKRTGRDIIADWIHNRWEFAEREYGGVCWYDLSPTIKLLKKVRSLLGEILVRCWDPIVAEAANQITYHHAIYLLAWGRRVRVWLRQKIRSGRPPPGNQVIGVMGHSVFQSGPLHWLNL